MAMSKKAKAMPKIVGYSLAGFIATAIVFAFFWILFNFFYAALIIDSDTYILFHSFSKILSLLFITILGFTFFPVVLYFLLRALGSIAILQKRKKSILKTIYKQEESIIYYSALTYWIAYTLIFVISFIFYSSSY